MVKTVTYYTKVAIWIGLFALLPFCWTPRPAAAQQPPAQLRLLAWSPNGEFLLGAAPGRVVTWPGSVAARLETLWLVPLNGAPPRQLAEGLDPRAGPANHRLIFTRLDAQNRPALWAVDTATAALHPLNTQPAEAETAAAGDPPGRVYLSPNGQTRAILVNRFFQAELWLGPVSGPARPVLVSPGEIFSQLSWRPDGHALAFIRTPLGSATEAAGELWRLDLPGNTLTRLSQNNVADRSPVWSPDGETLAIIRNEQPVIVPANRLMVEQFPPREPRPTAPSARPIAAATRLTPPDTIRVIHHASNTCRNVPVGQIDTYPFEEYVKRVVPYEVYPSWPAETLKAQAVAARTYAWDKYLQNPNAAYHVTDWINHQYMCDSTVSSTNQAVNDTAGEYLAYNGQVITAMFSAENSSPTRTNPYAAYLQAVNDPVSFGTTRNGHGYGMGQWGAQRWAAQYNWSYQAILHHYYTNVTLEEGYAPVDTAPPNVAIVAPGANRYLTANHLYLRANTADDHSGIAQTNLYLSTASTAYLLASQAGPAPSSGYVVDISAWADQALLGHTLVLTAEAFDATGRRSVSPPVAVGLDRTAPTARLFTAATLTPTTLITDSPVLSLTLTATDSTAGAAYVALGRYEWAWEGENLTRELVGGLPTGRPAVDAGALNGMAMQAAAANDPAGSWSAANITLPAAGPYRAYFRVKTNQTDEPGEVARLEVVDAASGAVIGLHRLRGVDFRAANEYQEFQVDFYDQPPASALNFRLIFTGIADISLDRFVVLEYPIPFTTAPTYGYPNIRLKVIDGAGNVSEDLLVLPRQITHTLYLPVIIR